MARKTVRKDAESLMIEAGAPGRRRKSVRFGSAVYKGPAPDREAVARNIAAGRAALARGLKALAKPGVKLKLKKGVPRYSADPTSPGVLIRNIDGRIDRVVLEGGEFRAIE